jgi:hypothetical protein
MEVSYIEAEQLAELLKSNTSVAVIDVREADYSVRMREI